VVCAGYAIELVFTPLGLVPGGPRHAHVGDQGISWNYTTVLNIALLGVARRSHRPVPAQRRPPPASNDGRHAAGARRVNGLIASAGETLRAQL